MYLCTDIWAQYIGSQYWETVCMICNICTINDNKFWQVPLRKNGPYTVENARPVCEQCYHQYMNSPNKSLYEYIQRRVGMLSRNFYYRIDVDNMELEYRYTCNKCKHGDYYLNILLLCPKCYTYSNLSKIK
jgi:hypothetical protein